MEVKDVFEAAGSSIENVLSAQARGFYIPSYQRPFAWDRKDVDALIQGIGEGLPNLERHDDALTFIGTLIFIHDTQYKSVLPQVKGELPPQVYLVIDGQQRLTTMSLVYVVLHNLLQIQLSKIPETAPSADWLQREARALLGRLEDCLLFEDRRGDGEPRFYPRLVRAHDDQWGYSESSARYTSPIARLLKQYSIHIHENGNKPRSFTPTSPGSGSEAHALTIKNYKRLRNLIRKLMNGEAIFTTSKGQGVFGKSDDDEEDQVVLPTLASVGANPEFQKRLWRVELPEDIEIEKDLEKGVAESFRLFMLANYCLSRVAVTQVLVTKEDYAFDMFEALNMTGEPLTSFDTFKPQVVRHESLEKYADSDSAKLLSEVERFLAAHGGADKRQAACNQVLIPFALFDEGHKLPKRLRDQRNWLRSRYDNDSHTPQEKKKFLEGMAAVSTYVECAFARSPITDSLNLGGIDLGDNRGPVLLCLEALRAANHHITIAPLARFFQLARQKGDAATAKNFAEAVFAVTAFFALWRGSRQGTDRIDTHYRTLMQKGHEEAEVPALASRSGTGAPAAAHLRAYFRAILSEDKRAAEEDRWAEHASRLPVYKQSVPLTKLLLLAADHDAVYDASSGRAVDGKKGTNPMLTVSKWADFTVEHVAPRTPQQGSDWDVGIYDQDLVDTLGNLTLVPAADNASLSNKNWSVKQIYYRALAAPTISEVKLLMEEAQTHGVELPGTSESIKARGAFLPHVKALAGLSGSDWEAAELTERGDHMARRAWRIFSAWLEL